MDRELKDRVIRWLTGAVLLVIFTVGVVLTYPNYRRSESLKLQNAELQEAIDRKKREIAALQENQRRFAADSDFVKMIARQRHRVFPGELVFIYDKE